MNEEIKKYRLERKNLYINYVSKGLTILIPTLILTGISSLIEDISYEAIEDVLGNQTAIVFLAITTAYTIKSIPITKKIINLKRRRK